jgi:hypothetical protein
MIYFLKGWVDVCEVEIMLAKLPSPSKIDKLTVKEYSWLYELKNEKKTSQKNTHTLFGKYLGHFHKKSHFLDLAFFIWMAEVRILKKSILLQSCFFWRYF